MDLGMLLIGLPFFMIGSLFLLIAYLIFKLCISDIVLKFLIESFSKDKVDMTNYKKEDKNRMNRYISIALLILFTLLFIPADVIGGKIIYGALIITIGFGTTALIYRNIKRLEK